LSSYMSVCVRACTCMCFENESTQSSPIQPNNQ
jgi:hypothetical protein